MDDTFCLPLTQAKVDNTSAFPRNSNFRARNGEILHTSSRYSDFQSSPKADQERFSNGSVLGGFGDCMTGYSNRLTRFRTSDVSSNHRYHGIYSDLTDESTSVKARSVVVGTHDTRDVTLCDNHG